MTDNASLPSADIAEWIANLQVGGVVTVRDNQ